ncbi:MAG: exosortase U, partial [Aureliella sp.]
NPVVGAWNYLFWPESSPIDVPPLEPVSDLRPVVPAMMALAVALCLWQSVQTVEAFSRSDAVQPVANARQEPFMAVPNTIPNSQVKSFTQVSHEHVQGTIDTPMGENGDVWRGIVAGVPVTIALNQPYPAWHDLTLCYRGTGWQLNDRQNVIAVDSEDRDWDYTISRWLTDRGTYAYVWFCAFDEHGQYVESLDRSLLSRLRSRANGGKPIAHGRIAMVQMVVDADSSLPPDVMDALAQAFLDSRQFLVSMVRRKPQE